MKLGAIIRLWRFTTQRHEPSFVVGVDPVMHQVWIQDANCERWCMDIRAIRKFMLPERRLLAGSVAPLNLSTMPLSKPS